MKEKEIMKNILRQLLRTGDAEIEQLVDIVQHEPFVIPASIEMASDLGCSLDWGVIIKALTNLKKDSVDYGQIEKEILFKLPDLESNFVLDEVEELESYINSIAIDDNGCAWGEIASSDDSKYSDCGEYFKELVNGNIDNDEFYEKVSDIMIEVIESERVINKLNPIAVCTITNNMSVLVYDIDHNEGKILAGTDFESAIWCSLDDETFKFGELEISLSDCIRI